MKAMELTPEDRVRRGRARAQRTEAIYRSEHVKALTLNPTKYIRPMLDKSIVLTPEQHHTIEFHLRQMWAICLLQNMQESLDWSWSTIESRTGKSRITWNNVTQTYFLPFSIYNSGNARQQINAYRDANRDEDGKLAGRARIGWKPVTKGFIFDVTTSLEEWAEEQGGEAVIFTPIFREAFDRGLSVVMNQKTHHDDVILRLGDSVTFDQVEGIGEDHHSSSWLSDIFEIGIDDYIYCFKDKNGKPAGVLSFPLLEARNAKEGMHNAWHWLAAFEQKKFDPDNKETGEPPKWCEAWHLMWELEEHAREEEEIEAAQENNPLVEPKPDEFFSDEFREFLESDDASSDPSGDYGGTVHAPSPISCDVQPYMLDPNGDAEVVFEVRVRYKNGRVVGKSIDYKSS